MGEALKWQEYREGYGRLTSAKRFTRQVPSIGINEILTAPRHINKIELSPHPFDETVPAGNPSTFLKIGKIYWIMALGGSELFADHIQVAQIRASKLQEKFL